MQRRLHELYPQKRVVRGKEERQAGKTKFSDLVEEDERTDVRAARGN